MDNPDVEADLARSIQLLFEYVRYHPDDAEGWALIDRYRDLLQEDTIDRQADHEKLSETMNSESSPNGAGWRKPTSQPDPDKTPPDPPSRSIRKDTFNLALLHLHQTTKKLWTEYPRTPDTPSDECWAEAESARDFLLDNGYPDPS